MCFFFLSCFLFFNIVPFPLSVAFGMGGRKGIGEGGRKERERGLMCACGGGGRGGGGCACVCEPMYKYLFTTKQTNKQTKSITEL